MEHEYGSEFVSRVGRSALALAALLMVTGCGAAADDPVESAPGPKAAGPLIDAGEASRLLDSRPDVDAAEEAFGLLLKLRISDSAEIAFLEPSPGELYTIERRYGSLDKPSFLSEHGLLGASVSDVWDALNPEEPLPSVLADAELRKDELSVAVTAEELPDAVPAGEPRAPAESPRLQPQHVTNDGAHFQFGHAGCPTDSRTLHSWCWLNRTGDWAEQFDAHQQSHVVANFGGTGSFTFRVFNGAQTFPEIIVPGQEFSITKNVGRKCSRACVVWPFFCDTICINNIGTLRGEITQGTGRFWHWGGHFTAT